MNLSKKGYKVLLNYAKLMTSEVSNLFHISLMLQEEVLRRCEVT